MGDRTPEDTTRAAVYTRVSTEDQAREGYGLDVQRERCGAYVTAKGWQLVGVFSDEGISGAKDETERPALAELLELTAAGGVDAVVVLDLDRLARGAQLALRLTDTLQARHVTFASVKQAIDTSTPSGRLFRTVLAGMAEYERDLIRERTTAGRNARGMVDGERGGRVPFGYVRTFDAETGKANGVEVDHEAAAHVARVFELRAKGLPLTTIADEMNGLGVPSPRGGRWYASTANVILGNGDVYRGGRRGPSPVRWPCIVDPDTAETVLGVDCRRVVLA